MQPKVKVQGHARKPSASRTLGPDLADLSMIPVKGATIDDQVKNFIRDLLFRGPITLVNIVLCVQKRVRSSAENDASAIEKYNSDKEITPIIVELGVIVRRHYVLAKTGVDNVDQVRDLVINMFTEKESLRKQEVFQACLKSLGAEPVASVYTRVMQELGVSRGSIWTFKSSLL